MFDIIKHFLKEEDYFVSFYKNNMDVQEIANILEISQDKIKEILNLK